MIKTSKYEEVLLDLEGVIHWLNSHGLNVSKDARIKKIIYLIKELVEARKDLSEKNLLRMSAENGTDKYVSALMEADDFRIIYRNFKGSKDKAIIRKLYEAVKGPFPDKEESTKTIARDCMFELWYAAVLKESGFMIVGLDDVKVVFENINILFECKRLSSEDDDQIYKNIKTALRQLTKKLQKNEMGVVVLSIEKTMKLFGKKFKQNTENELLRVQNDIGQVFFFKHAAFIDKSVLDPRILGFIATNRSEHILDGFRPTKAKFFSFYCIASPNNFQRYEYGLFESFRKVLEDQYLKSLSAQTVPI